MILVDWTDSGIQIKIFKEWRRALFGQRKRAIKLEGLSNIITIFLVVIQLWYSTHWALILIKNYILSVGIALEEAAGWLGPLEVGATNIFGASGGTLFVVDSWHIQMTKYSIMNYIIRIHSFLLTHRPWPQIFMKFGLYKSQGWISDWVNFTF